MFEDFNKLEEEHYRKKQQEWDDLVDKQIDKIVDKVNLILSTQSIVQPNKKEIERYMLEDIIKECIREIHSYTCKEMIDYD